MCRGEETRLLLELYMPYVGLGTHRMYDERKPPRGIRKQVRAGTNTIGVPLFLTCLRSDARMDTDYEAKAKKSASDTTVKTE